MPTPVPVWGAPGGGGPNTPTRRDSSRLGLIIAVVAAAVVVALLGGVLVAIANGGHLGTANGGGGNGIGAQTGTQPASTNTAIAPSPTATTPPAPTATATTPPVTAAQFAGVWINDDSGTRGIPQLVINASGTALSIHGFGACSPTYCDWGSRSGTFGGQPFTILFDFGSGLTDQLDISLTNAGTKLKVVDVGSASGTNTYYFHQ
jgi:hypothetical protein